MSKDRSKGEWSSRTFKSERNILTRNKILKSYYKTTRRRPKVMLLTDIPLPSVTARKCQETNKMLISMTDR